ncbi:MFS transporter [Luteimicrobium subarcticum]|uniref:EmrB/QacA subfamily drug resistance transporter n=1 Tax=Luteimicrobium subarcticum TaxID=620910 RepID=A0A2M8WQX5_9MICO|nr:MFS transporter [Luteimicrobium subarcticum]PJI93335.1 EmrB/QacA subfamily drug resistance transporter [Luteimicrobium subarcticum]
MAGSGKAAGGVLAATCLSTLVVNANTSAVSILLPAISDDTGTPVATLQWAVTGYSLVGAAVIITAGSLGDVFGRKRVFQLGLALFVLSCVLIALAQTGGLVIVGRLVQGAAGSTILACGLSLLSVATSGERQLRAVSLWGAAAAVGAAAGPLLGGVLVGATGWQGLFWIDAAVAVVCIVLTYATVAESSDPDRPRDIDYLGSVLVALTLMPLILGVSKSGDWGWASAATLGCFAVSVVAGVLFVVVEKRVAVPLLDLSLLRNRILVGSTVAILIGAGTINGLMYLLSLYFQSPDALGFSPLEAGLATLPATAGLVVVAPLVPRLASRLGGRQVVGAGFVLMTVGFAAIGFVESSWAYVAFLLPVIAIAVGMGLSNGPASSAATASVRQEQVGAASGVSNMARYVGAAVATALAATVYGSVDANHVADGASAPDALAAGLAAASWVMVALSLLGVLVAVVAIRRVRTGRATLLDTAAAAAAHLHTLPTSASGTGAPAPAVPEGTHTQPA